jgi:hypothetical protein
MRWTDYIERIEEMRNAYKISVGKRERKGPFRRPKCTSENNIKMDLTD